MAKLRQIWTGIAFYGLLLALAVGGYALIRMAAPLQGSTALTVPLSAAATGLESPLFHFLLALAVVLAACTLLGRLFKALAQPPVVGEVLAGILLGPSFLGRFAPGLESFVLPASVGPLLGVVAQLGVVLYMFQVGLELNHTHLKGQGPATLAISHAGIVLPFLAGAGLALWLYPRFAPVGVAFDSFALFMGVALSITAFPVLARILSDLGMQKTRLGTLALACAAVDDATAWCLLAVVVGVAQARLGAALWVFVWLALFVALLWLLRPLLLRLARGAARPWSMALVLLGVLACAAATEGMGLHAVFGAFLLGAFIPHDSPLARAFEERLKDVVAILLLPAFFAVTGLRTRVDLVQGWQAWEALGLILAAAVLGKFGGVSLVARLFGRPGREAVALGLLMNTRGLVELIVLSMGLDLGVISPELFTLMVLMALATTLATVPALQWWTPEVLPRPRRGQPRWRWLRPTPKVRR